MPYLHKGNNQFAVWYSVFAETRLTGALAVLCGALASLAVLSGALATLAGTLSVLNRNLKLFTMQLQILFTVNVLKVIRKFFLKHNKSFRWHLGDYEKHIFSQFEGL